MDKPLDIPGMAEYLGISEVTVRLRVKRREWPFTRLPGGGRDGAGKLVRFTEEHVAAILAVGEHPALNGPLSTPHLRSVPTGKELAA